jgi:hypothetical protein
MPQVGQFSDAVDTRIATRQPEETEYLLVLAPAADSVVKRV